MKRKVLIILLLIVGLFVFTGCGKEDPSKALKQTLEEKKYTFSNILYVDGRSEYYIISKDKKVNIIKTTNETTGEKNYYYNNNDINEEYADINNKDSNESDETKAQYKSYEKWLKENELTKDQVLDLLDYYANNLID
jgi:predicted ATP-binding protein involved in virulence